MYSLKEKQQLTTYKLYTSALELSIYLFISTLNLFIYFIFTPHQFQSTATAMHTAINVFTIVAALMAIGVYSTGFSVVPYPYPYPVAVAQPQFPAIVPVNIYDNSLSSSRNGLLGDGGIGIGKNYAFISPSKNLIVIYMWTAVNIWNIKFSAVDNKCMHFHVNLFLSCFWVCTIYILICVYCTTTGSGLSEGQ